MSEEIYDIIIIGGGPAGVTAAIYASRHNNKTLVLEGNKVGGKTLEAHWVENYPGFPEGISGSDLMDLMVKQATKFGAEFSSETVVGIADFGELKMLTTRKGIRQAKAVIVATGIAKKSLSVTGENEFKGRGVSYCGVCDGPFFREKTVAIVGGGHEAVHDIEVLGESASKVYAIPGKKGFSEDFPELDHINKDSKVEFIYDANVTEIGGSDFVEYMKLDNGQEVKLDGVFIILEHVSTSSILSDVGIETDAGGCILTDRDQKTNVDGLFAAGDCCCRGMQIVTATGMGAMAALSAMKYVRQVSRK
jgi:thioredoxin reductase (NADPH)